MRRQTAQLAESTSSDRSRQTVAGTGGGGRRPATLMSKHINCEGLSPSSVSSCWVDWPCQKCQLCRPPSQVCRCSSLLSKDHAAAATGRRQPLLVKKLPRQCRKNIHMSLKVAHRRRTTDGKRPTGSGAYWRKQQARRKPARGGTGTCHDTPVIKY